MAFKGITDEKIKEELDKRTGIARPGPKEFLMDALSFAPAMLGMPAAIIKPHLKSSLLSRGKRLYKIPDIALDVLDDYIEKLPKSSYRKADLIKWHDVLPAHTKGQYVPGRRTINLNPNYLKGFPKDLQETVGIGTAKTLMHELTHLGQFTDSEFPILSKIYKNYHKYLQKSPDYFKKYYTKNPLEVHARRVAKQGLAAPEKFREIYRKEMVRTFPEIPLLEIDYALPGNSKQVQKYQDISEEIKARLMRGKN